MATTPTHFASGQISSTKGVIYAAPATPAASVYEINKVVFTNTIDTRQDVIVYRDDGDERILESFVIPAGIGKSRTVNTLIGSKLEPTDSILAVTTTDNAVNFQIDGKITG